MSTRIYLIQSKTGKKKIYVRATTKTQALRTVMAEYFNVSVASHEELYAAFQDDKTEIIDATLEPQIDIEEKNSRTEGASP